MNLRFCTLEVPNVPENVSHFFSLPIKCHYVNTFPKKHPERAGQCLLLKSSNLLRKERCQYLWSSAPPSPCWVHHCSWESSDCKLQPPLSKGKASLRSNTAAIYQFVWEWSLNAIRAETLIKPINSFVFLGVFAINMQNPIDSSNSIIHDAVLLHIDGVPWEASKRHCCA